MAEPLVPPRPLAGHEEVVRRLSRAVEYRDAETGTHLELMSAYCGVLGEQLGFDRASIEAAAPMHDVGKVAVPDRILFKPGRLTPDERNEMERHTEVGHDILSGSGSSLLELAATIALTHHERWDGSGYPHGLVGEEIPLAGRIAALADVFDALTSDRAYRRAFPVDDAVEMVRGGRGTEFDPQVVDAFLAALEQIREIHAP
jgi:putative two-component system response regulator